VIERMANCRDDRLREIMTAVVTHVHAIIKEVEPTFDEWAFAIDFLTRTGKICDDTRQEFILLSDTLGVTMLVDAINHRRHPAATESTVLGPFHVSGAPHLQMGNSISRDGKGEPLYMSGKVVDASGQPIDGALLDVWQTSADGFYDVQDARQPAMNLRGQFTTGAEGRYWFRSIKPSSYPIPSDGTVGTMLAALGRHPMRPAHVHFIVTAPGHHEVTTHVFVEGDPYLESDAVFGVKESLIVPFVRHDDPSAAERLGLGNPFYTAAYDFVLERQSVPGGRDALHQA
jgi:protocatechuate 3,4-dioxygenase beta subunit